MKRFRILVALFVIVVFSGLVLAVSEKGEEALQKLMDGNKRFVSGTFAQKDLSAKKREELSSKGQKPFATVLTCSDSRVPPELLFDQGLGDIFVIRVAGNVIDPIALGSIEYAAEHLGSPLLFILGHSKCGAVKATLEGGKPEGNIVAIVKKIMPAADAAKKKGGTQDEILETAIKENVKNVYSDVMKKSKIIPHLVEQGKLTIFAGEYDITTGKIERIELPKLARAKSGH
jgi:carbonic anhydrase